MSNQSTTTKNALSALSAPSANYEREVSTMDYMAKQFNAYFLRYMQADKKTRKQCRAHWESAYALNVKNGLKDAADRAAEYLQVIRLADKILAGEC